MKCQDCQNDAVVHITELQRGKVVGQLRFCERHAVEHLSHAAPAAPAANHTSKQNLPSLPAHPRPTVDQLRCPMCGISFAEIRKTGRLGCAHDYLCFGDQLEPILRRIHGKVEHRGKTSPRGQSTSQAHTRLIRLRRELDEAVADEDYERAGRIRDEIRRVQSPPASHAPQRHSHPSQNA